MTSIEDIFRYVATKGGSAYYPPTAGDDPPDMLERLAERLQADPRIAEVDWRQHPSSGKLLQLRIELEQNTGFVCSHTLNVENLLRLTTAEEEHACPNVCGAKCRCVPSVVLFE